MSEHRAIQGIAVLAFLFAAVSFLWGQDRGYRQGEEHAQSVAAANRAEHNALMRKVGVCSWAKVMATQIECQREFKPGEP